MTSIRTSAAAFAVIAGSFVVLAALGDQPMAQVLDAARGHEDGCDRPEGPPFSPIATSENGPVVEARYFEPTRDYGHGVLGDAIESEGLVVRYDDGERVVCDSVLAGPGRVFEDVGPRLADINGDGVNEVIAVAAEERSGARLELYGYPGPGQDFQLLAATPYIGTAFRWLAPIGAADFDGDGRVEIAYVETPHLGKTIRIVAWEGDQLVTIASGAGFSNHRIGEEFISGGVRDCGDGPEMMVADWSWRQMMAVRLVDGELVAEDIGPLESAEGLTAAATC